MEQWWNDTYRRKPKVSEKSCAKATSSTQMQWTIDGNELSFVAAPKTMPVYVKFVVENVALCLTFAPITLFFPPVIIFHQWCILIFCLCVILGT